MNTEVFLDSLWEKTIEPKKLGHNTLETWVTDEIFYSEYKDFLKIFDSFDETKKQIGNAYLYYKENMSWPDDIDPEKKYQNFLIETLEKELPIKIKNYKKSWGVKYCPSSYSGFHNHTLNPQEQIVSNEHRQLTAVMFLNNITTSEEYPLAGALLSLQPLEDYQVNFNTHIPKAGNIVIMDGRVWHGTYPTIDERKVFVVDFEYELTK